jgi:alkylation response protein AidB-like acyl-CoA dehydrogenase
MVTMTGLITDTGDHRLIRQSTAAIASRYGHAYYAERARDGGHIAELWADLGHAGLLGVHLPEQYGGGGAGLAELVVVTEELAAHGLPLLIAVISPAICGSILAAADAALAALDQSIQTHGGNGLALEYGLADLWFVTRLMRTAPVSREMVLNYVASHSLGLPQSY